MDKFELKKYLALKKEALSLRLQAEQLDDEAKSLKATTVDGMPKSNIFKDSIGEIVAKIEEIRLKYLHKYDLALCELYKIERTIDGLDDATERQLMRKRYIEGKNWEDICVELNYSWRQVHRLHSEILKKIIKYDT